VAVTAIPRGRPGGWFSRGPMSRSQMALARCSAAMDSSPAAHWSPTRRSAGVMIRSHRSISGTPSASRSKSCLASVSSPDTIAS